MIEASVRILWDQQRFAISECSTLYIFSLFPVHWNTLMNCVAEFAPSPLAAWTTKFALACPSMLRLRSASTAEVLVPATRRSTIGAFAVARPRAWNNLPVDLRLSRTFTTFKTHLKSHLFNLSFPSVWLYHWLFLYRALEAACAAYASLNLSLLHYIMQTSIRRHSLLLTGLRPRTDAWIQTDISIRAGSWRKFCAADTSLVVGARVYSTDWI